MATQTVEAFPQRYARVGGVLYLAIIVLGAFAEGFVANKLLISGDAAATAHHILTSPGLWRLLRQLKVKGYGTEVAHLA